MVVVDGDESEGGGGSLSAEEAGPSSSCRGNKRVIPLCAILRPFLPPWPPATDPLCPRTG